MELNPVITEHLDVIQGAGAMGMPRHLNFLRRCEVGEDLLSAASGQGFQLQKLLTHIHFRAAGQLADLLDLLLQFNQRLLKFEQMTTGHSSVGGEKIRRRQPEAEG